MGEFSFTKADGLTQVANIVYEMPFKLLIPQEFGGGFVKDRYQGGGLVGRKENGEPKYDVFELLAFWNREQHTTEDCVRLAWMLGDFSVTADSTIGFTVKHDDRHLPAMKKIDKYTRFNRAFGIWLYNSRRDHLIYPLKLVSASYQGTYEECQGVSDDDPNQGLKRLLRPTVRRGTVRGRWPF